MGPEAAVNAVYANKIAELPEDQRARFVEDKREEYRKDIDIYRLASELVVDHIVDPNELRAEVASRLALADGRDRPRPSKRRSIPPV
jgi:acetyl-CoA carboxylase carboxyltransferase component